MNPNAMRRSAMAAATVMTVLVTACATARPEAAPPNAAAPIAGATLTTIPKGFRMVVHGQRALYCRYEAPVGSNIRRELCMTAEQLQRQQENVSAALETAEQDSLRRAARSAASSSRSGR